jgi:hypothetical protein
MPKEKPFIKKLTSWLDQNLLTYLAGFLLVFIPLYPKIPLFEAIPGYIVRVRVDDVVIALAIGVWLVQVIRKKVNVHPLLTKLFIAYAVIGLLSSLSALFITKTVPITGNPILQEVHVLKLFLHYFRRLEYFSLFFIFFSAVTTVKQVKTMLTLLIFVVIGISLYGYGQKYLYWPVYSTMNREFSKGMKLYLTEGARVPSTFGGHYDAAAFVMIALTVLLGLFFFTKSKVIKIFSGLAYAMGFWLLILTASRISFIGYLAGITIFMAIAAFVKSVKWAIPRYAVVMTLSMFVMLSFGDLAERYAQMLGLNSVRERFYSTLFSQKAQKPADFEEVTEIAKVTVPSDRPPTTEKPTGPSNDGPLPPDVSERIPIPVAEVDENGNFTGRMIEVSRTYSDNAYKYGLSAAIRFDALWPRATEGFLRNPLLGSGYSTLTKETVEQFTEAESTDNDFLRALGETGLLGFLSFFGIIATLCFLAIKQLKHIKDPILTSFVIAFVAATAGMLLNAIYIDVFEASKVALTYWALAGLLMATLTLSSKKTTSSK